MISGKIALISLSDSGARLAIRAQSAFPESTCYFHAGVSTVHDARRFDRVAELTARIFNSHSGLIYFAPCGVVVRSIAGLARDKKTDPAVIVVDAGGRFAISLLSGHEGGANDLTFALGNILGAEPVITTTTEARKDIIVGVGCRRDVAADDVMAAIRSALEKCHLPVERVRMIASADIKSNETGLIRAAEFLGIPLRFISSDEINNSPKSFKTYKFVKKMVNLPAVAEPAALLAGRRTTLILPRITHRKITVAIAREQIIGESSML